MKTTGHKMWLAAMAVLAVPAFSQTYTKCNPLQGTCPADPALGKSVNIDMTSASDQFTSSGNPTYGSDGASFSVGKSGDSPTITSKWYMMFGRVEVNMKAAPGTGIVSSMVLQSDDLDEIDFEWLGGDDGQVQSNYFGKGQTLTYNRGAFHPNSGNHDDFHTYAIEWTPEQIVWQINGKTVRALTSAAAASNQYPQTPMQLKLGAWAGGDPSNAPGTIQWAGGPVDYSNGPYAMVVKSVKATDYSTGSEYTYGDNSGSWKSIQAKGGKVNANAGQNNDAAASAAASAPSVSAVSTGMPAPFATAHTGWPWVATGAAGAQATDGPGAIGGSGNAIVTSAGELSAAPNTASTTMATMASSTGAAYTGGISTGAAAGRLGLAKGLASLCGAFALTMLL